MNRPLFVEQPISKLLMMALVFGIGFGAPTRTIGDEKTTPKEDCEKLVQAGMGLVEDLLGKQGGFIPVGFWMESDGRITSVGTDTGKEHPSPTEVLALLRKSMAAMAEMGKVKATAVFYDVRVVPPGKTEKRDAIAIDLEHRDGYRVTVYFPYSMQKGERAKIDDPFSVEKNAEIFKKAKP